MTEIFNSKMGQVTFRHQSYCVGCQRFEPFVRNTVKTDEEGKVIFDANHQTIINGVDISCTYEHMCSCITREVASRVKRQCIKEDET